MNNKYYFNKKINKWKKTVKKFNHQRNKLGYRSDCSGFVSYMWNLDKNISKGGPRTRGKNKNNLKFWGKKISKKNLKKGDIIMVPNQHVVMFDRWYDKDNLFSL